MRTIDNIVVHCSDSLWGCAREIREWHLKRGFTDIGYHFVILNGRPTFAHERHLLTIPALDGSVECGRYLDDDAFIADVEVGAHALGYNASSIGVCLIGTTHFTPNQHARVGALVRDLQMLYHVSTEAVLGHYETPSGKAQGKTCPNISMELLRAML
jgi:hypothetical protein